MNSRFDPHRPRRSALYVPAANRRAMEKAAGLAADCVILDLEDAVAPEAKDTARDNARAVLEAGLLAGKEVVLRVNGLDTPQAEADFAVAALADAVLVPKIESARDIARCEAALRARRPESPAALWAMIETPRAVMRIAELAGEAERDGARLSCFVVGANDLAKETRAAMSPGRAPLLNWLSACVLAARACGLVVLDSVYNDFRDSAGFEAECRQGRDLGFDGKTLIHPSQIEAANALFAPSAAEIAAARAVVAAFALPENTGRGVITVDGRMTERLHLEMARALLMRAGVSS